MRRFILFAVVVGCVGWSLHHEASASLLDELVGYWPLDDLDASDASGNGLDGTIVGLVESTEDRFGNPAGAMLFAGFSEDHVDLGDREEFRISGAMSVAAWVILDSGNSNNGRIIAKSGNRGQRAWSLNIESGNSDPTFQVAIDGDNNISVRDLDPLPQDQWVHMAGVYHSGQQTEIYVNGELKETLDFDVPDEQHADNGLPVLIGARNQCGNCGWVGSIDDVALWRRALSEQEVMELFHSGIGGSTPGDFNSNGVLDAGDLDLMAQGQQTNDPQYDLNGDGTTDIADRLLWVNDLRRTWIGDADLNGEFNSGDFVLVFQRSRFEKGQPATWAQGDWDGDLQFGSGDFVLAFQENGFERGPRMAVSAVPEPAACLLTAIGLALVLTRLRRKFDGVR